MHTFPLFISFSVCHSFTKYQSRIWRLIVSSSSVVWLGWLTSIALCNSVWWWHCFFSSPLAHPDWFKDGKDINNSQKDRVTRYNRSVGKRLIIKEVRPEDEGEYSCVVNNEVGKVQRHSFHVKVVSEYCNVLYIQTLVKERETYYSAIQCIRTCHFKNRQFLVLLLFSCMYICLSTVIKYILCIKSTKTCQTQSN